MIDKHDVPKLGLALVAAIGVTAVSTDAIVNNDAPSPPGVVTEMTVTTPASTDVNSLPKTVVKMDNGQSVVLFLDVNSGYPICDTAQIARPEGYSGPCSPVPLP